jgi:hypothetical protein
VTPAATRRTIAAVVTVWILGLLLVLGMWQRVDAACQDAADPAAACLAPPETVTGTDAP